VSSAWAATSTASEIAMPSEPGCPSSNDRPAVDRGAVRLHQQPAVGLLVVRRPDLPHLAVQPVHRAGEGQRRTPLTGPRLGREAAYSSLGVVVRLWHSGVRLVRPGRGDALVLVVDVRRCTERGFQPVRPMQRGRPPEAVHLLRDVDVPLAGDLLHDQVHREQRRQVVRADRLQRAGVQRRRRGRGQVGHEVVPLRRQLGLGQHVTIGRRRGHGRCLSPPRVWRQ
jgi:hypothetical protein